jgi:F0F1-type ATP synthase assembly protein I
MPFDPASFKRLGPIVALAWSLPAWTIGGGALGWGIDQLLGSNPIATLVGGVAGFAAAVVQMLRLPPPPDDQHPPPPA